MKLFQKNEILVTLVISYLVSGVFSNSQIPKNEESLGQDHLEKMLRHLEPINFLQKYTDFSQNRNSCDTDLGLYVNAVQKLEPWALKMVDASSKIPSGILQGNFIDLGMFDECISVHGNFSTEKNEGKHCIYELDIVLPGNVTLDLHPKLSMCIPSTCDIENVKSIIDGLNQLIHKTNITSQDYNIKLKYATCSNSDFEKWSTGSIIAITVISLIIIFLLFCTILEFSQNWIKHNGIDSEVISTLARFSLYNNSLRILSTKANSGSISAIHGIRALSIFWVVYGHEIYFGFTSSYVNLTDFLDWASSWRSLYLVMAVFAVDTFLLLSGFLLSYLFLKRMSQGGNFNLFEYYLHRYIRLTPAVAALITIVIYIAPHLGSGPRWEGDIIANVTNVCGDSWWKFLLYVQNYVGSLENLKCMGHLWYLAVDMQLFVLSPLILYPLHKKPRIGLIILAAFFIASVITPGVILAENELTFNTMAFNLIRKRGMDLLMDSNSKIYIVTHCRAGPWLLGIFFGFIMVKSNRKPKGEFFILGWIVAATCFAFCSGGFLKLLNKDYEYDVLWESIFASFSRSIWAVGVAWIIYACHHGYGGLINKLLSLTIFLPISRISYSIYILHYLLQHLKSGAVRLPGYFSNFTMFQGFLSDVILSCFLSFLFCIIFESPILILEKMIFGTKREKTECQNQQRTNGHNKSVDFGNGFVDKLEKGETTVNPPTNELATDL